MKSILKKTASVALIGGCLAFLGAASPAQSHAPAMAKTINFYDPSCRVSELAPSKLQADGVPRGHQDKPWWYLVVNFNSVIQQGKTLYVKSCLRVGNSANKMLAKSGLCKIIGDVQIRQGMGYFNDGYLECNEIDIGAAGLELGIPLLGATKFADTFWIAVKGSLNGDNAGGALLRYESKRTSNNAGNSGSIAINVVQAAYGQREGFVATESPDRDLQGDGLGIVVRSGTPFTGLFEAVPAQPDQTKLVYGWSLFGAGLTDAMTVSESTIAVGIGESTLYIGGLPSGKRFHGKLDLIVFDPKGGRRTG